MTVPSTPRWSLWHWMPGLFIALAGSAASYALWHQQSSSAEALADVRFAHESHSFAEALQLRLSAHAGMVLGLANLFTIQSDLGRCEFERVARELDLTRYRSSVRNVTFVRWLPGSAKAAFEERVRGETVDGCLPSGFQVRPGGARSEYFVVDYLWPRTSNEAVLGLDIASQPSNLESLIRARDTRQMAMSAPFDLLQERDKRTAIVIRAPVFVQASGGEWHFTGAVGATIRVHDMVASLRREGYLPAVALSMADVGAASGGSTPPRMLLARDSDNVYSSEQKSEDIEFGGRRWRLSFQPRSDFLSPSERRLPWLLGLGGLAVTGLLTALVLLLTHRRAQAQSQALAAQSARTDSEERFRTLFNQAAVGVAQTRTSTGELVRVNQKFCDIVGYSAQELQTMCFQDFTHPDDLSADLELTRRMSQGELAEFRLEKRYVRKNGDVIAVELNVSPMRSKGGLSDFHIAAVHDISARKDMEAALRSSEQRLLAILNRVPVGVCLVQPDGSISFRNERFTQICGYDEAEMPDVRTWWVKLFPDAQLRATARARWRAQRQEALDAGGDIPAREYTISGKDGQRRTIEGSGALLGDAHMLTLVDLSQRKADEEEIRYLAYYDPLTRLPNRRLLVDRLQQALAQSERRQRCGALLMLDLDNFKTLNETRGHDKGDMLLREVAQRLRGCVSSEDTVARHGGDEFVVVLEDLEENLPEAAARAREVALRILSVLREPFVLDGQVHHSTLSIGVTVFQGQRESADELIKRGDLAMYQAKASGRDRLQFYDPQMQASVAARAALEVDMRTGLRQGQFELFYQPQVVHGRITGAEALLRWRHPQRGFVSPAEFIPLAEECGLILPLGEWVLQDACQRLAQWSQRPGLSHLSVSVNVSPRQFHQGGFVAQVLQALASTGADARHLKLELTEGLLLQDVEDTIDKMGQLRAYGVGFSLDDFGTGYSSLAYLKRLPLDELKIDQSFVRDVLTDPNDAAIARTIVALGTSLGLRVTAEGVETKEQRAFLERAHCHAWQGYLLSPPLVAVAFEEMVLTRGETTI